MYFLWQPVAISVGASEFVLNGIERCHFEAWSAWEQTSLRPLLPWRPRPPSHLLVLIRSEATAGAVAAAWVAVAGWVGCLADVGVALE